MAEAGEFPLAYPPWLPSPCARRLQTESRQYFARNGAPITETLYFGAREEHLPVVAGFMALSGLDARSIERFLKA